MNKHLESAKYYALAGLFPLSALVGLHIDSIEKLKILFGGSIQNKNMYQYKAQ